MNFIRNAAIAGALALVPAAAQTFNERPFDPPVGSRWQIVSQTDSEDTREAGQHREQHVHAVSEFGIEEKLADGFRISSVSRNIAITGNAPGTAIVQTAFGAMKDLVVRVRTDRAGKPLAVENVEEVRSKMRLIVDRMTAALQGNPRVAEVVRTLLNGFMIVDGAEAARLYAGDVSQLAVAQNTGLKPGEVRRQIEQVSNPFGGTPIKSTLAMRIAAFDSAAGTVRYTRTREMDPEAMRAFILEVVHKLAPAANDKITPEMIEMMKRISFEMTSETTFDVAGGMTRSISDRDTTTASLLGHTFKKVETKVLTVTPLGKP